MGFFTPQERFIILFLILSLVVGFSLYLYKLNHPSFAPAYIIKDFGKKMDDSLQRKPETQPNKLNTQNKININTAGTEILVKIPGIGTTYAKRIIEYRKKHNGFHSISEIKKVEGIGEKRYLKIKEHIKCK